MKPIRLLMAACGSRAHRSLMPMNSAESPAAFRIDAVRPFDVRCEPRLAAAVPVRFNRTTGVTRNVSKAGVFIQTDRVLAIGMRFELALEFFEDRPDGPFVAKCDARVVRISETRGMRGMAATIRWLHLCHNDQATRAGWTIGY